MGKKNYRNVNDDSKNTTSNSFLIERMKKGMIMAGEGEGEGEAEAVSFKISRKSEAASNLKAFVSEKLLLFLVNYTDDVLAEYITVLVCNGKNQYQAKDDLEAFLGERSGEFVSWLWELLLKHFPQGNGDVASADPKDAIVSSSHDSHRDKDSRIDKSGDFKLYGTDPANAMMTKDEKFYEPSASACIPVPRNDMKFSEGFQHRLAFATPFSQVNTKKVLSQECRDGILRRVGATENINENSLTFESSGKGSSSVIPPDGEQGVQCTDKSKKIVYGNCSGLRNQLLYLPKRELVLRNPQSAISGRIISPRSADAVTHQNEKLRRSVWDRLGKPCADTSVSSKIAEVDGVGAMKQNEEVLHKRVSMLTVPNVELSRRTVREVPVLGNRCGSNNPPKSRESEHGVSTTVNEPRAANNIRRKRNFGEISNGACTGSVSLVGDSNMDFWCKEPSQDSKKSNLTDKDSKSTPKLVSEVLDVKQRLRQIEMEMSKLRAKQMEKEKGGKPYLLLQSGVLKHQEDDIESRTVFLTNVHFAATKESISLYFTKCGAVDNVVILTDKATGQPKGAAYVTFASKESVGKAVALSGTTFFSRTVKVLKKAEAAVEASASAQLAGKLPQASLPQLNRNAVPGRPYFSSPHLQWRRESTSAPSEASAPAVGEGKEAVSTGLHQQLLVKPDK